MAISFLRLALGAARFFVLPFHQLSPLSAALGERRLSWSSDNSLLSVRSRQQDVEKGPQLRSRSAQSLNVRTKVRLGFSFAAALLGDLLNILNSLELRETGTPAPCPCSGLMGSLRDVLLGQVRRECSVRWVAHFAPQGATAPLVQAPGWTASRPDAESQPLKGFGYLRLGP